MPGYIDTTASQKGRFGLAPRHPAGPRSPHIVQEVEGEVTGRGEGEAHMASGGDGGEKTQEETQQE